MQDKIKAFPYIKGRDFTKRLKNVIGASSDIELGEKMGLAKTTISTWNTHDRNSHELVVRTHLRTGIPIHELILPLDYPITDLHESFWKEDVETPRIRDHGDVYEVSPPLETNPQHEVVIIESFCLSNGQKLRTGEIPYPARLFNSWNLNKAQTIELETNDGRFLIDKSQNDAVSGEYLIEIDGRMSINHIQRLPNKLAVAFGENTLEVDEGDIQVTGRVAVTLSKK